MRIRTKTHVPQAMMTSRSPETAMLSDFEHVTGESEAAPAQRVRVRVGVRVRFRVRVRARVRARVRG